MASTTKNIGLNLYESSDGDVKFRDFRNALCGYLNTSSTAPMSNMEKIDYYINKLLDAVGLGENKGDGSKPNTSLSERLSALEQALGINSSSGGSGGAGGEGLATRVEKYENNEFTWGMLYAGLKNPDGKRSDT